MKLLLGVVFILLTSLIPIFLFKVTINGALSFVDSFFSKSMIGTFDRASSSFRKKRKNQSIFSWLLAIGLFFLVIVTLPQAPMEETDYKSIGIARIQSAGLAALRNQYLDSLLYDQPFDASIVYAACAETPVIKKNNREYSVRCTLLPNDTIRLSLQIDEQEADAKLWVIPRNKSKMPKQEEPELPPIPPLWIENGH